MGRPDSRDSATARAPTAEEIAASALARLLRGGTWEALAGEIAWEAARSTGVELSCLDWLPDLIAARLSEHVDGLEFVVEGARTWEHAEHLRAWPHDHAGAEAAAAAAGDARAEQEVSRVYLSVLEWSADLLNERMAGAPRSLRPRLPALRRARPPAELEVPALVAEGLTGERPRYGWPDLPDERETRRPRAA